MVDKVGVDDAQAFLLATADQLRTVDLYTVDIDQILVEGATTHGVLRRELVVGVDVGKGFDDGFDALVWTDVVFDALNIDLCEGAAADAVVADGDGIELFGSRMETDVELGDFPCGDEDAALLAFKPCAGEPDGDGVGLIDGERIAAEVVGSSAVRGGHTDYTDRDVGYGFAVGGDHAPLQLTLCLQGGENAWQ